MKKLILAMALATTLFTISSCEEESELLDQVNVQELEHDYTADDRIKGSEGGRPELP